MRGELYLYSLSMDWLSGSYYKLIRSPKRRLDPWNKLLADEERLLPDPFTGKDFIHNIIPAECMSEPRAETVEIMLRLVQKQTEMRMETLSWWKTAPRYTINPKWTSKETELHWKISNAIEDVQNERETKEVFEASSAGHKAFFLVINHFLARQTRSSNSRTLENEKS